MHIKHIYKFQNYKNDFSIIATYYCLRQLRVLNSGLEPYVYENSNCLQKGGRVQEK